MGAFLSFCLQQHVTSSIKESFLPSEHHQGFLSKKDGLISHGKHHLKRADLLQHSNIPLVFQAGGGVPAGVSLVCYLPSLPSHLFMVVFYYYLQAGCLTGVFALFLGLCHLSQLLK